MTFAATKTSEPGSTFAAGQVMIPPVSVDKYDAPSRVGNQGRKRFHVMVKPGGSTCNLDCKGGVYSCDHYVYPEYRLGNLKDSALNSQVFSRTQVKFGYAKNETLPAYCRQCPYLTDCWGECPKNRIIRAPDGEPGLNYLCAGFKKYFAYALPEVERIVADLRKGSLQPRRRM